MYLIESCGAGVIITHAEASIRSAVLPRHIYGSWLHHPVVTRLLGIAPSAFLSTEYIYTA